MITIYTQETCGPCYALKRALDRAGVRYEVVDALTLPDAVREEWRRKGWTTPVVDTGTEMFSGFIPAKVRALTG